MITSNFYLRISLVLCLVLARNVESQEVKKRSSERNSVAFNKTEISARGESANNYKGDQVSDRTVPRVRINHPPVLGDQPVHNAEVHKESSIEENITPSSRINDCSDGVPEGLVRSGAIPPIKEIKSTALSRLSREVKSTLSLPVSKFYHGEMNGYTCGLQLASRYKTFTAEGHTSVISTETKSAQFYLTSRVVDAGEKIYKPRIVFNVQMKGRDLSNRTCYQFEGAANIAAVTASCGDHFLFPGYYVTLVAGRYPCRWRFRSTIPSFALHFDGDQMNRPVLINTESRKVESRLMEGPNKSVLFADLVIELVEAGAWTSPIGHVCSSIPIVGRNQKSYGQFTKSQERPCGIAGDLPDQRSLFVTADTFPWEVIVELLYSWEDQERVEHCSGSAISEEWVLTTASCFLNRWTNLRQFRLDLKVRFGANSTNGYSANYSVRDVILYPGFSDAIDIALVRLAGPFRLSWDGRLITPICLPPYNPFAVDDDVVGHDAMILGWTDADHPRMQIEHRRIIHGEECGMKLGEKLPPHTLCTMGASTGGPCLRKGHLLRGFNRVELRGLTSSRAQCQDGILKHTSVSHFMPWIVGTTGLRLS